MDKELTFAQKVLQYNQTLSSIQLNLPDGFRIINPFAGDSKDIVENITKIFYEKYYNDNKNRYLILGSSPARRGTALTGVPFEDALHLQKETGIMINNFYDSKSLQEYLRNFIIESIRTIISFGIDTSVCFCIGSGKNFSILNEINKKYNFFENIIPLEHPRYIMQYNSKNMETFFNKYLVALKNV